MQSFLSFCIKQVYLGIYLLVVDPDIFSHKVQNQVETIGHCQVNMVMLYQCIHSNYHVCSGLYNCHSMTYGTTRAVIN